MGARFLGFATRISLAAAFLMVGATGALRTLDSADGANAEVERRAEAAINRATGLALQGDGASAAAVLAEIPAGVSQKENAEFRSCMISRFGPAAQPLPDLNLQDAWVGTLARSYLDYWQHALTKPGEREQAESDLRSQISKLLGHAVANDKDFDAAEDEIKTEAKKRGFHVLLGRTQPLRELMLWRKLVVEEREVSLPEGPQRVTVNFLDDFVLRGWGYFATCGRRSAGGWATEDGLFAVVPAYKSLDDETFSVRFLAHESQHFADKRAFPKLESWELEYRAKLVELALANESQGSTLQLICENRGESKDSPHGYANFRVVSDLAKHLQMQASDVCENRLATGQRLRTAAKKVLLQDSRERSGRH